mmetsp:Transcript_3152/g.6520  ORF Transcript_3152/g.6520 Transcript_3152/m.6520 type:complete len:215 (+) Transcript_3152:1731-2375(+)
MASAFADRLSVLDATQESIQKTSAFFLDQVRQSNELVQPLIDSWSQAIERLPQKVALLFLANDIIQNSKSDVIKSSFQGVLCKAISVAASQPNNLADINRVISVWEERRVYHKFAIEQFKKACEKVDSRTVRSDHAVISHIISLAKTLKRYEEAKTRLTAAKPDEELGISSDLQKARGKLIEKLVYVLKKMNHAHLEDCIYLQRIYNAIELQSK